MINSSVSNAEDTNYNKAINIYKIYSKVKSFSNNYILKKLNELRLRLVIIGLFLSFFTLIAIAITTYFSNLYNIENKQAQLTLSFYSQELQKNLSQELTSEDLSKVINNFVIELTQNRTNIYKGVSFSVVDKSKNVILSSNPDFMNKNIASIIKSINRNNIYSIRNFGPTNLILATIDKHNILHFWYVNAKKAAMLYIAIFILASCLLYGYFNQSQQTYEKKLELYALNNQFITAMENSHFGLWTWNLSTGKIFWSTSIYDILGYKRQYNQLALSDVKSIINEGEIDLYEIANDLLSGKINQVNMDFPMRHAKGHSVWLRLRAKLDHNSNDILHGIAFDVSEQWQQANEIAKSDRRLKEALENISESFVLWDNKGQLVMFNNKYREYSGLTDDQLYIGALRSDIEAKSLLANENSKGSKNNKNCSYEKRLNDKTWVQVNDRLTQDGGMVSIATDISNIKLANEKLEENHRKLNGSIQQMRISGNEVKQLNKKLTAAKERAEAANKAKSDFLANMSHELRTPLNAIIGFSEMMINEAFGKISNKKYEVYLQDIHSSGKHLLTLINDILDMSKIEAGQMKLKLENTNISELLETTQRLFDPMREEKDITLTMDINPDLNANVDKRCMKQIFINILSNAVKFTKIKGKVNIKAYKDDSNIKIIISDNGVGIPENEIAKLGKPFAQVENQFSKKYAGSGLGLAISKSLLSLHNGDLKIKSTKDVGTKVTMTIPC